MIRPEDVPAELVEKAARAIHEARCCPLDQDSDCYGEHLYVESDQARHALAAVLPDIQAQARKAMADDLTWLADAREEYQHEDVVKETDSVRVALGVAQGEPAWGWLPSWRWDEWKTRAARLTETTEEPTK